MGYINPDTKKVNLRALREDLGLSLREMAPLIGKFSTQTVYYRESRGQITLSQFLRLQKYLEENERYAHDPDKKNGRRIRLEDYLL